MKFVFVLFMIPALFAHEAPAFEQQPLEVRIANVRNLIGVGKEYPEDQLHVVITNRSSSDVEIYDQWNSWGYDNIDFTLESESGMKTELRRFGGYAWSQNAPDKIKLKPGEQYVYAVWLMPADKRDRSNTWGPVSVQNGDYPWVTLEAHYDGGEINGRQMPRISSKPMRIRLKDEIGELPVRN